MDDDEEVVEAVDLLAHDGVHGGGAELLDLQQAQLPLVAHL